MNENSESNALLSDASEANSDLRTDSKNTVNIENLIKSPQMENSATTTNYENVKFNSSEDLIKKLTLNTSSEKDPRRFIKITEIIEINNLADSDTNNSIRPRNEFIVSNHSETMFNSLSRKLDQNFSMSSSHSFDTTTWQKETPQTKELPIKIEKNESKLKNQTESVQNTEIVLEILNAVNSLETFSKKPKKIIVKITGRTRSNEPNSEIKTDNLDKKTIHYQHENLSQYAPIKPNPVKIGNRVPYYNFKPINKQDFHNDKREDRNNEHIFDLEKFKSYFNKSSYSRSFSMPPNINSEAVGSQVDQKLEFLTDTFNNRSSFKKINRNIKNLNRDYGYACSDSEDSVWTYRNKNDSFKKNFARSNSTILNNFSNDKSVDLLSDSFCRISNQNFPVKNDESKFSKRKDVDLYQESLRRNFARSDKKFYKFNDHGNNFKNISSYYNKFYSCLNDFNKKNLEDQTKESRKNLLDEEKTDFVDNNISLGKSEEKTLETCIDLEKSVKHFSHNNRQCLSTFLPIKNSQQLSQIRSQSINSSPNRYSKPSRKVIFADELN